MKNIIFVCHGNICRSPAAEWIMKDLLRKYGLEDSFLIISRAASREEIGNDIYPPMKRELNHRNIAYEPHHAMQITKQDYDWADYIFYMDNNNLNFMEYLIEDVSKKYVNITKYSENPGEIDDPWYSGEYEIVCDQITQCCEDIIKNLLLKNR